MTELHFTVNFYQLMSVATTVAVEKAQPFDAINSLPEYGGYLSLDGKRMLAFDPYNYNKRTAISNTKPHSVPVICHGDADGPAVTLAVGHSLKIVAEQEADSHSLVNLKIYFTSDDYLEWRLFDYLTVTAIDGLAELRVSHWSYCNQEESGLQLDFLGSETRLLQQHLAMKTAAELEAELERAAVVVMVATTQAVISKSRLSLADVITDSTVRNLYLRNFKAEVLITGVNQLISQSTTQLLLEPVIDHNDQSLTLKAKCPADYFFVKQAHNVIGYIIVVATDYSTIVYVDIE